MSKNKKHDKFAPSIFEYERRDSRFPKRGKTADFFDVLILLVGIAVLALVVHFYVIPLTDHANAMTEANTKVMYEGKSYKNISDFCDDVRKADKLSKESDTSDMRTACNK